MSSAALSSYKDSLTQRGARYSPFMLIPATQQSRISTAKHTPETKTGARARGAFSSRLGAEPDAAN